MTVKLPVRNTEVRSLEWNKQYKKYTEILKKVNSIRHGHIWGMIVNFMCQFDWAKECPGSW